MTQKPDGGPAYPRSGVKDGYGRVVGDVKGMSLRDYFAGQIINGMYSDNSKYRQDLNYEQAAKNAYIMADAMIAERNKP